MIFGTIKLFIKTLAVLWLLWYLGISIDFPLFWKPSATALPAAAATTEHEDASSAKAEDASGKLAGEDGKKEDAAERKADKKSAGDKLLESTVKNLLEFGQSWLDSRKN